jgi:hypothetical protein
LPCGSIVQTTFQFRRREHERITTEGELGQLPLLEAFDLATTGLFIHQNQVEIAAEGSRPTAIAPEHTDPLKTGHTLLLLPGPGMNLPQHLLRGWPAPNGLLQRAHGHG